MYRAQDELLGRPVAIKIFEAEHDQLSDRRRRHSEMRVLASLNHPALVSVFDGHLEADPSPYFVMELIEGRALSERLRLGPLTPADVALMTRDLGEALSVVHAAGVVHRDIKPSNVLLAEGGNGGAVRAKLADFGIATFADAARLTMPGALMGTAAYLAPEQLRGASPAPPADIYSLGLVILESLSGQRAFPGSAAESMSARLVNDPGMPQSVPVALRQLIAAMTARDPDQRPAASDVAQMARIATADLEAEVSSDALATMPVDEPSQTSALTRVIAEPTDHAVGVTSPRPRRLIVALIAAGVLLAGSSILVLTQQTASGPEGAGLPATSEPLGAHLQQLLESVTP